jgi:hypothetical protein
VWQGRRRLRRLEKAVADAQTAQTDLQRRVDVFEQIAAAAGAALDDTAPLQPVPPSLVALALDPQRRGSSVRLVVGDDDVIAVVGDEGGDPSEWWTAIRRLATQFGDAS